MPYEKSDKLHIITAVAVIRRNDGRILLLKRRDDETVYPGHYTFPGGKVEGNDTISQTLKKEVKEECGLELEPGFILIKEKAIGRPDGQTSKSLSFLCSAKDTDAVSIDKKDFTDYAWVTLDELRALPHVGIEAEFIKAAAIYSSHCDPSPFFTDTDQVDFRQ
ncbi:MAG: 7,8-dihydro-8-oxoguanine triphosphatase [Parcubacteria group bacterium Greene0714_21]|nr:MAG: 7,8-dihydro-8-oxoguanine triphosphatase [Parcubacteria group bacterium Greene0416_39]TSC97248.1 MAG: 7,8-dihydro-8-oxoguanine triphosphatase [Parcubacteria group bacterium Greene1014_47]TSD04393.1 MAG: 7,8-dihydro-8-oxoguanine triphosphatase [Parcubacteria group bacterium Greene0714_21]